MKAAVRGAAAAFVPALALAGALAFADARPARAEAAEEAGKPKAEEIAKSDLVRIAAIVGASFCVSTSVMGAAWALAKIGTAVMGAVAEKPELMGRSLIFVGLAEGLSICGFITALIILR